MTMVRRLGLVLILLSGCISVWWGRSIGQTVPGGPFDFQDVYYGARCLLEHHNPYSVSELEGVYRAEGGDSSSQTTRLRQGVTLFVNLPATLLFIAPFAMLPLATAQVLWISATAVVFILAACLVWDRGARYAPILSTFLVGFLLANSESVFATGNTAGMVVGLCVVAVWCFLEERFLVAGVLCMAVSLAVKPHDAGFVWLFFLLAGGAYRKRALQTLAVTAVLAVSSILWVSHVAPHWIHDWQTNMRAIAEPGGFNDPRPASVAVSLARSVISLQAVFSVFSDDPQFYNWASYLVCGLLLLVWTITTLRSRLSQEGAWLALATIVPITILFTYHRLYDARLLLLTVPACALLWVGGGPIRWIALVLNAAGIVVHADIPMMILEGFIRKLHLSTAALSGQIFTVVLARPNQDILLAMSVFYLWVYVRRTFFVPQTAEHGSPWSGMHRADDSLNRLTPEKLFRGETPGVHAARNIEGDLT